MKEYLSYPEGYNKLVKKIIPWYMRPMKKMLMSILLLVLAEG